MADNWFDDDDDEETQPPKVGDLPEPARKHMRKMAAELAAVKKQLAERDAEKRTTTAKDVVKAKGYNPNVASLLPAGLDSSEAIEKWLEENGSMFAKAETTIEPPADAPEAQGLDPALMAQLAALTKVTGGSISPTQGQNLRALIDSTNSKDELDKLLAVANKR